MNTLSATLVIGATGTTGSRVVAGLIAEGHRVKAAGRSATPVEGAQAVRFDWDEPATWGEALDGVDRLYLVPPIGSSDPAAAMLPFLDQARAAGVHRAVLLSSSAIPAGGPAVGRVHQALPGLFEQWAVLRPSWFMQNFTGSTPHARSIREDGAIWTATGQGRVGFIDAQDIAAVAVPGRPASWRTPPVSPPPSGRAVARRSASDAPIADGTEDRTTDTVQRLTGRLPGTLRAFLEREVPGGR
ncbi:NAD(P)H-binding protein [Kitasatospora sp. NBC_00374]|uniref:NAD(P)H-binding protein n=1 Tax=Kitasatospora sp. NBC_00374 TaxID=2975964 RepID=UPI0030E1D7B8